MTDVRAIGASFLLCVPLLAGLIAEAARPPQSHVLTSTPPPKVSNRQLTVLDEGSRHGVRLDAHDGDGVAWWPDVELANGTIELDLRGKDVLQHSFVGVAFHGVDDKSLDAVYFRPFNFKSDDPVRRSHAVQYISHPTYTWNKLRTERPGQFEQGFTPTPDPNGWFHARIVLDAPSIKVFVNDISTPVLDVKQLNDRKTGWVGVWVGNGSDGAFANVTVTPATPR